MSIQYAALPDSWVRARIDRISSVSARIGWKALTAAEYQPEGYAFLATPNIKSARIDFESVNYISSFRYDESPELKLAVGDVLLAKDGNTLGICNVVRELPRPATVNGSIAVLRPRGVDPRFLYYVLSSYPVQRHIDMVKDGMGVPHLFQRDIKRIEVPFPPLDEQWRIADFLDAETARIDRLAAARLRQRVLISERWQTRLAEAVSNAVQTCGELPLRRVCVGLEQGWSPQCDDAEALPEEWAVLKTSAVSSGRFDALAHKLLPAATAPDIRYKVDDGDLLLTRGSGSADLVGMAAVAQTEGRRLLLSDLLYRAKLAQGWSSSFVALVLRSQYGRQQITSTIRGAAGLTVKIRGEDILGLTIPQIPPSEQAAFTDSLERAESELFQLSTVIDQSNVLLAERRQALITAAVTGQFNVTTARGADLS
ncbi:restriction endonuclease subunit S [Micromonospora sp. DT15]|uniref:restriction endonuclease subunit S n=1 Tax=Micromonospora sp. DT15 TaxID=3393445 RepID=UPI003CEA18BD